jgi:hypothetical protein
MQSLLRLSLFASVFAGLLLSSSVASANGPIEIGPHCWLGDHPGVDDVEATTAAAIVCHEVESRRRDGDRNHHEVRFGRLGGETMVTLAGWEPGGAYDERRAVVTDLREVRVAGPRLADALTTRRSMEDTRTVDNVLAAESPSRRTQRGAITIEGGAIGLGAFTLGTGASAGGSLGVGYRASNVRVGLEGRLAGIGGGGDKLVYGSVDVGGRVYFSSGDFAPFLGAGLGGSHATVLRGADAPSGDLKGSGVIMFAQVGAEMLRTHHVALTASLRIDAPIYALEGQTRALPRTGVSEWILPLSLSTGLVFQ